MFRVYRSALPMPEDEIKRKIALAIETLQAFGWTKGKPRPTIDSFIEACLKRVPVPNKPDKYVPDYEIIDDIPGPIKMDLEQRKTQLVLDVARAESIARSKLMPQRKIRLFEIMCKEASLKKEDERTDMEKECLERMKAINETILKFALISATAEAAIEDLNETTIDDWRVPTFE